MAAQGTEEAGEALTQSLHLQVQTIGVLELLCKARAEVLDR